MTSYQILKRKCEYLQSQLDMFKNALTVVKAEPALVETHNHGEDSINYCIKMLYSVRENAINEEMKQKLNHWVAMNLDKDTIMRLLKMKEELENGKIN